MGAKPGKTKRRAKDLLIRSQLEGGFHTKKDPEKDAYSKLARDHPEQLVDFGAVLHQRQMMPGYDRPDLVKALRQRNPLPDDLIAFIVEGDLWEAEEAVQNGANVLMGFGFTPAFMRKMRAFYPNVLIFEQVSHDSPTPKKDLNKALAMGVDGVMLKRFADWSNKFPTGPLSLSEIRRNNPDLIMMGAGGIFESNVNQALARPENIIVAVGFNATDLESFRKQADAYVQAREKGKANQKPPEDPPASPGGSATDGPNPSNEPSGHGRSTNAQRRSLTPVNVYGWLLGWMHGGIERGIRFFFDQRKKSRIFPANIHRLRKAA